MTWHGQINRTIWEIGHQIKREPRNFQLRKEYLRTHFLQRYELDRSLHIPRDDRSFLFLQEKRAPVCLLLHGENGTPAEMRDLGNYLYARGLTLYCPRISRYDSKDRPVSWESWLTAAEGALTTVLQYSRDTIVIGASLGGTIALLLDELHRIKALTLLAPAVHPRLGFKARLYSLARHIMPNVYFRLAGWDGETTKAMERVRGRETKVTTPMLALQAKNDNVVSGKGLKFLSRIVMNDKTEIVVLPDGAHTITRGDVRQDVFERVYRFLGKIRVVREQSGPVEGAPPKSPPRASSGRGPRRGSQGRSRRPGGERAAVQADPNRERPTRSPNGDGERLQRPPRERRPRRGGRGRGGRGRGSEERKPEEQTSQQKAEDQRTSVEARDETASGERPSRPPRSRSRSRRPRGRSQSNRDSDNRPSSERAETSGHTTPDASGTPEQAPQERRAEERRSQDRRDVQTETREPREPQPDQMRDERAPREPREPQPDQMRDERAPREPREPQPDQMHDERAPRDEKPVDRDRRSGGEEDRKDD